MPSAVGGQGGGTVIPAPRNLREDPELERFIEDTPATGNFWLDFDPTKQSDEFLDNCFLKGDTLASQKNKDKPRNFWDFVGPLHFRPESKVRYFAKYYPSESDCGVNKVIGHFKKTTLVRVETTGQWHCIQDRVPYREYWHKSNWENLDKC